MVSIEIAGLDKLIKAIEKYPQLSEKHVNKAIANSLFRIEAQAKRNAPYGSTAQLKNNWIVKVGRFQGSLSSGATGESGGYKYGLSVEYGTRPHYVSPNKLKLWAVKKGLNPYAVAKTIAKKGTKKNPFFQQSIDTVEDDVSREFATALENIINEI